LFNAPSSPPTDAFFSVTVQEAKGLYPVAIIQILYKSASTSFVNFTLVKEGNEVIGGLDGYQMEYTAIEGGHERKVVQFAGVANGLSYVISRGALTPKYSLVLSDLESILNSFQVTIPSPSPIVPEFPSMITISTLLIAVIAVTVTYKKRSGQNTKRPINASLQA
jgi:hypothetical protein